MQLLPDIEDILTTAKIRLYRSFNDNAFKNVFQNGAIDPKRPILIYTVTEALQHAWDLNPDETNPVIRKVANYLFWLVAPIAVVNKNLLSINLSAVAVSTTEIDLAWIAVPHAEAYTLERALDPLFTSGLTQIYLGPGLTFHDTGRTPDTRYYYRIHASAVGYNDSPLAYADAKTLPVPVTISIDYYYGDVDFYDDLVGGVDAVPYVGSQNISNNAPFTITWPAGAANNKFQVIRIPRAQSLKTFFFNTPSNQGAIPGPEYQEPLQPAGLPAYTYICSRTAISLDGTTLTETFS